MCCSVLYGVYTRCTYTVYLAIEGEGVGDGSGLGGTGRTQLGPAGINGGTQIGGTGMGLIGGRTGGS